ncbi:hypothetical protein [uncultured Desulfuromonas sp.]|uniref:hypothetical protein n=1 Tax=uncultured Desulfuromonas sp. TaxID=181013 RepID=UPI0026355A9D|nr:hypothetical protein [uncultured Desulfuromonas sp.]
MKPDDKTGGWNPLCAKCIRGCRQPVGSLLLECPRFLPPPFKVERHRFDQLDLFGGKRKTKK